MKIASALSERRWQDIDLILEQFGFSTTEYWEGDAYSYVVQYTKGGTDEALLELHEFLFPGEAPSPREEGAADEGVAIWQPGYFRLFISHSSKQADDVGALKRALRPYAIDAFVAHDDIDP